VQGCRKDTKIVVRKYPAGIPYQKFKADSRWRNTDVLLKPANVPLLANLVTEIVSKEGPIHEGMIVERLKEIHATDAIPRNSNTAANIVRAIESTVQNNGLQRGRKGYFIFRPGEPDAVFRVPGDGVEQSLELVAPEEIESAILHVVEDQFGVIRDQIPHAVAKLFGVKRLSSESAGLVDQIVDDFVDRRLLRTGGNQVYLA
jgi:hypothetical protein